MPPARAAVSSFFSSRRRHTRWNCDWSSDVCSSDLRAHVDSVDTSGEYLRSQVSVIPEILPPERSLEVEALVRNVRGSMEKRSEERRVGKECRAGWAAYH